MSSEVDVTLPAWIVQAGRNDARATIALHWDSANPAEITMRVVNLDELDNVEVWHAARSAFVVALLPSHHGTWAGAGSFAVKHNTFVTRLAFKPLGQPRTRWAFVDIPTPEQVRLFVEHTIDLCPLADESRATLRLVERAIDEIFGARG